jgi:hypothetical protein
LADSLIKQERENSRFKKETTVDCQSIFISDFVNSTNNSIPYIKIRVIVLLSEIWVIAHPWRK